MYTCRARGAEALSAPLSSYFCVGCFTIIICKYVYIYVYIYMDIMACAICDPQKRYLKNSREDQMAAGSTDPHTY